MGGPKRFQPSLRNVYFRGLVSLLPGPEVSTDLTTRSPRNEKNKIPPPSSKRNVSSLHLFPRGRRRRFRDRRRCRNGRPRVRDPGHVVVGRLLVAAAVRGQRRWKAPQTVRPDVRAVGRVAFHDVRRVAT